MRIQLSTLLALVGLSASASAQIEYGGAPLPAAAASEVDVPTLALPGVNRSELLAEDAAAPKGAFRFGVTLPTDVSMDDAGVWQTLADGTRVWRLRFESPGAHSLSFLFSRWQLSEGAELFLYNDRRETVRGAYTWLNNKPNGQMAILPTPGQAITIEYIEPAGVAAPGEIEISGVVHDYRDFYALDAEVQPSRGGSCNVDVNCSQGNNWRTQIDATVQTILGGFVCSAMMINNTANDGRQLVMSANHCGTMNNAVFRFNYQRSGCNSGGSPTNQSVQGSTQLATATSSDFRLAVITPTIPVSYGATFGGWNRGAAAASNTIGIHHPSGCPKKISFDNHSPTRLGAFWRVNDWDLGTTEGGSSGSPLFDQNGRFVGQLYGGFAACGNNSWDEYGALNSYWNSVRTHLDPLNTGQVTLDAFDPGALPVALNSVTPSTIENLIVGTARDHHAQRHGLSGLQLDPHRRCRSGRYLQLRQPDDDEAPVGARDDPRCAHDHRLEHRWPVFLEGGLRGREQLAHAPNRQWRPAEHLRRLLRPGGRWPTGRHLLRGSVDQRPAQRARWQGQLDARQRLHLDLPDRHLCRRCERDSDRHALQRWHQLRRAVLARSRHQAADRGQLPLGVDEPADDLHPLTARN